MEERKAVVRNYVSEGLKTSKAIEIADMSRSTYYTKRSFKRKGRTATQNTLFKGAFISNEKVVCRIKEMLVEPYIDYGYKKITICLQREGYKIGRKKVYRLMKESKLLQERVQKKSEFNKNIIKDTPKPTKPLEILELDIKYVYINGLDKNAYLMSILDTFTRQVYEWKLEMTMKTIDIKVLIEKFIDNHLISKNIKTTNMAICFRTDNGSQFTSKMYQRIMETFKFTSTYIPPATPQLNGHIESFHSVLEKEVCGKNKFNSLLDAKEEIKKFMYTYNNKRNLTVLLDMPPILFRYAWEKGEIVQKEKKKKLLFFFKEEDKEKQLALYNQLLLEYNETAA
jgi:transposase InsO family protein